MNNIDRQILQIAWPAIVTNITVPLLGLVDSAIVGHMGSPAYIGAVAVGAMMFNLVYWVFAFLRMGTSGLTAQAYGRHDCGAMAALLRQSLTVALTTSAVLLVLQWPLREFLLWFIGPTSDVRPLAATYYNIVVWGAPASLSLFSLTGWFIGMQDTRSPMMVSIVQNVTNIIASLLLVYVLGMKVEGVAFGTVIAQYAGLLLAVALKRKNYGKGLSLNIEKNTQNTSVPAEEASLKPLTVPAEEASLKPLAVPAEEASAETTEKPKTSAADFFRVNRDIMLRTLCLVSVNLYFTAAGARQGATILAVNALLMQLYLLFSYILDGFAYAGEALGGRYWGAADHEQFRQVVSRLFRWGWGMTALFTVVYVAGGLPFLNLLTDEPSVVLAAADYMPWAWLVPLAGVAAFVWDGIYIGITATRGMLLSCFVAAVVFFVAVFLLMEPFGNHGLWIAMLLFLAVRGLAQTVLFSRVTRCV